MTSQALEQCIQVARGVLAGIDSHTHGAAIRTQAAVVRTLVDELDRHLGVERCAEFLGGQVQDELSRLMALVSGASPARLC